jgi:transposase
VGANTQAVLLSAYRTLKQRGHDQVTTLASALANDPTTSTLPPLPAATASNG